MTYTFSVNGRPDFFVQAASKLDAMGQANKHFGCLPQGAWMSGVNPVKYHWALGNFFD